MAQNLLWFVALGPFGFVALGLTPMSIAKRHAKSMLAIAQVLCSLSSLTSVAVLVGVSYRRVWVAPLVGFQGVGFSLYLDLISASMFALVSFIGLIVIQYSRNYLDGDPGQGRFVKWISLTLGSVLSLMISGNLAQFLFSWICTSLSLHQLLIFYPERPAAILAARKKWVVSRLGDLCLVAAMVLIYQAIGSLEYVSIFEGLKGLTSGGTIPVVLALSAPLLAFAAILKSAQFPIHGWLLEVMETSTPVSALLHAGIINAGGFLIIRFSQLVALSPVTMNLVLLIGTVTAIFGSIVMLTQTSVKVSLAYSTIAQMGFMMLECGLGVFSAAMLHILAHSLYKAHAFLSSGSAVEVAQLQKQKSQDPYPANPAAVFIVVTLALIGAVWVCGLLQPSIHNRIGTLSLGCVFALGMSSLFLSGLEKSSSLPVLLQIVARVWGVTILFFGIQYLAEILLSSAVAPEASNLGLFDIFARIVIVLLFAVVAVLQRVLPSRKSERWLAIHTHISNGFYINTIANRLAIRFWPSPAPRSSVPSYIPSREERSAP